MIIDNDTNSEASSESEKEPQPLLGRAFLPVVPDAGGGSGGIGSMERYPRGVSQLPHYSQVDDGPGADLHILFTGFLESSYDSSAL